MPKYVITLKGESIDPKVWAARSCLTACASDNIVQAMRFAQDYAARLNADIDPEGLTWRMESVEPMDQPETGSTPRQLRRFYAWIGLFAGVVCTALIARLLGSYTPNASLQFYLWIHHLQGLCLFVAGALIVLAAVRADGFIRCENHLLLALADKVQARREALEEKQRKEEAQ